MPYLIKGASDFLDLAKTPTGLKLNFFDPEKVRATRPYVESAHLEFTRAVAKLEALFHDRIRNEVMKHAGAKQLSTGVTARLTHLRNSIVKDKTRMEENAYADAAATMSRANHPGHYDSLIVQWIGEQAKSAERMAKIKKEFNRDFDVAGVIFQAKHFVLNLSREVHANMRMEAIKKYDSKAYENIQ